MALKKILRHDAEPNMGPFSDIAFLLIIFFILTTSLVRPMGRSIEVPSSMEDPQQKESESPTLVVTLDKILLTQEGKPEEELTALSLRTRLAEMNLGSRAKDKRTIVVDLAEGVPYEFFYRVATAISRADGVVALLEEAEGEEKE